MKKETQKNNHQLRNPSDFIIESFRRNIEVQTKAVQFAFQQADKILTWLIGFSITILTLILSKFSSINSTYPNLLVKAVLYLLVFSIVSGITYRILSFFSNMEMIALEGYFNCAFSNEKCMNINAVPIEDDMDYHELILKLKNDFGIDYSEENLIYSQLEEEKQTVIRNNLRTHYNSMLAFAKKNYNDGMAFIEDTYRKADFIPKKHVDAMFSENKSKLINRYRFPKLSTAFAIFSIVAFISALTLLVVYY